VTDEGRRYWLEIVLRSQPKLRLFANDATPTPRTTAGQLHEIVGCGYEPAAPAWKLQGARATAVHVFALTGRCTVFGWFVDVGGVVLEARRFESPFVVWGLGGKLTVEVSIEV
jgi:hypothetical protein